MVKNLVIPGATVTAKFSLPVDATMVKALTLDYSQNGEHVFSKTKEDCTLDGTSGTVILRQEDTLKFADSKTTKVQIVVLTTGGETIIARSIAFNTGIRQNRQVLE
jgi:hypothetical protein